MTQFALTLMDHPVLFFLVLLSILSFIGMTYEFILRLFGKPSLVGGSHEDLDLDDEGGMEGSNVPLNPAPDDVLHESEQIPESGDVNVYCNETTQNVEWVKNNNYEK